MKTYVSIFCTCLVLSASVCGEQRGVEERLSDLEKRVSALEKPSPVSPFKPSPSPVETQSPLKSNQVSEGTKADTESKPTPEPTEENEDMNDWSDFSPNYWSRASFGVPDKQVLLAVTRHIPDQVYIQRVDLDGVAVGIFRFQDQTVVARHDFRGRLIAHIEWSPDSRFLLFTTSSSGGHSPWHAAAFVFCATDNSFRDVDAAIGSVVSPKFHFDPPDIASMVVKKGEAEEEVKVSLSKIVQQMPVVK